MHWRRKWQPTPVFLPGESQGQGSLVGCRLRGGTESDTTEATLQQQQQRLSNLTLTKALLTFQLCLLQAANAESRRRQWHPTPVLLPRKSHGQGSLGGCSPRGR